MAGHIEYGEVHVHAIGMKAVEGAFRTEVETKFVEDLIVFLYYRITDAWYRVFFL